MLLSALDLTPSGRPRLWQGEVEQAFLDKVDLQFETEGGVPGCVAKRHEDGFAVLTTHRLIWVDAAKAPSPGASCYAHLACCESVELSATKRWSQTKLRLRLHLDAQRRPASGGTTQVEELRLVARSYGDFGGAARRALHARAWEAPPAGHAQAGQQQQQGGPVDAALVEQLACVGFSRPLAARACQETRNSGAEAALHWLLDHEDDPEPGSALAQHLSQRQSGPGIVGILRREQEVAAHNDRTLEEAFVDLRGLMAKAAEMVQLAEKFRGTLAVRGGGGEAGGGGGEEALPADMQQQLIEMGIASPVTREATGARYHMELSRQLADFLTPRLAAAGGLLTLADVYCLFNRARGTELVSPDDLLQAAQLFPTANAPMHLRTFASGLLVVQSSSHDDDEVCGRIAELVGGEGLGRPLAAADVAAALAVPLTVASQHLATAEARELLCRDDGPSGLRFFRNFFEEAAAAAARVQ